MENINTDQIVSIQNLFDGREIKAYVYDCYDGDTFKCVVTIPGTELQVKIGCRANNYDSPEMRSKDINEKKIAIICRDEFRKYILKKEVILQITGCDKYGRYLATIHDTNYNDTINKLMLARNLGHPYVGGTKNTSIVYNDNGTFTRDGIQFSPIVNTDTYI